MENQKEVVLARSSFDISGCHKFALIFYLSFFILGWITGCSAEFGNGFLMAILCSLIIGGIIHITTYFSAKYNHLTLTNYKITGVCKRHSSLNIPIDSILSISDAYPSGLMITTYTGKFTIFFISNKSEFCFKLNEILKEKNNQTPYQISTPNYQNEIKKAQLNHEIKVYEEYFNFYFKLPKIFTIICIVLFIIFGLVWAIIYNNILYFLIISIVGVLLSFLGYFLQKFYMAPLILIISYLKKLIEKDK